jgi:hypothetical protein
LRRRREAAAERLFVSGPVTRDEARERAGLPAPGGEKGEAGMERPDKEVSLRRAEERENRGNAG